MRISTFLLFLSLTFSSLSADSDYTVIKITDGDTVSVIDERNVIHKIRLAHIDSPEISQQYGLEAKEYLNDRIIGKKVTLIIINKDRYGRLVADILINDESINLELVQNGLAWHYTRYSGDLNFKQAQLIAQKQKLGLWKSIKPIPPWEYRVGTKKSVNVDADNQKSYWLNTNTNVRHNDRCKWFQNTKHGKNCNEKDGKACELCGG